MTGWSMAPWLRPGDILLVEPVVDPERLGLGDVVVLRNRESGVSIVHRIVRRSEGAFPFETKGDRNRERDPKDAVWEFQGVVARRFRNGDWTKLSGRRLFWTLSVLGLYPGQRLPIWMSRSTLRKVCGRA
jgi:signal peptidase I